MAGYWVIKCPICDKEVHLHENGKITNLCDKRHLSAMKLVYKDLFRKVREHRKKFNIKKKPKLVLPEELEEGVDFEIDIESKKEEPVLVLDLDEVENGEEQE